MNLIERIMVRALPMLAGRIANLERLCDDQRRALNQQVSAHNDQSAAIKARDAVIAGIRQTVSAGAIENHALAVRCAKLEAQLDALHAKARGKKR